MRHKKSLKKKGMRKKIYLPSNVEKETNEEVRICDEYCEKGGKEQ